MTAWLEDLDHQVCTAPILAVLLEHEGEYLAVLGSENGCEWVAGLTFAPLRDLKPDYSLAPFAVWRIVLLEMPTAQPVPLLDAAARIVAEAERRLELAA